MAAYGACPVSPQHSPTRWYSAPQSPRRGRGTPHCPHRPPDSLIATRQRGIWIPPPSDAGEVGLLTARVDWYDEVLRSHAEKLRDLGERTSAARRRRLRSAGVVAAAPTGSLGATPWRPPSAPPRNWAVAAVPGRSPSPQAALSQSPRSVASVALCAATRPRPADTCSDADPALLQERPRSASLLFHRKTDSAAALATGTALVEEKAEEIEGLEAELRRLESQRAALRQREQRLDRAHAAAAEEVKRAIAIDVLHGRAMYHAARAAAPWCSLRHRAREHRLRMQGHERRAMQAEDSPAHLRAELNLRSLPPPAPEQTCVVIADVPRIGRVWESDPAGCFAALEGFAEVLRHHLQLQGGCEIARSGERFLCLFGKRQAGLRFCFDVLKDLAAHDWDPAVHRVYRAVRVPSQDGDMRMDDSTGIAQDPFLHKGLLARFGAVYGPVEHISDFETGSLLVAGQPVWGALDCLDAAMPGELVFGEDVTRWDDWLLHGGAAVECGSETLKAHWYMGPPHAAVPAEFGARLQLERSPRPLFPPVQPWWIYQGVDTTRPWTMGDPKRRCVDPSSGRAPPKSHQDILAAQELVLMMNEDMLLHRPPPEGSVMLVFTDVQGATALWDASPAAAKVAFEKHNKIIRKLLERHQGYEVKTEGNAFMLAFQEPKCALDWCLAVQLAMQDTDDWPTEIVSRAEAAEAYQYDPEIQNYVLCFRGPRVCIGIGGGEPDCEPDPVTGRMDYFGPVVNLAARISGQARGGEIIAGQAAFAALQRCGAMPCPEADVELLGLRTLKGIARSESLFSVLPKKLTQRRVFWQQEALQLRSISSALRSPRAPPTPRWVHAVAAARKRGARVFSRARLERAMMLEKQLPQLMWRWRCLSLATETREKEIMQSHDTSGIKLAPFGQVTLAFTDIQGSTTLWGNTPYAMKTALAQHNALLRHKIRDCDGYEVKTEGDAFMVAFSSPSQALRWCVETQLALLQEEWPQPLLRQLDAKEEFAAPREDGSQPLLFRGPRVRMGFNSGRPDCERDPVTGRMDYFGPMVNLAARVSATGRGGEIVIGFAAFAELTQEDAETRGVTLSQVRVVPKGEIRLKGIKQPETVHSVTPRSLAARQEVWEAAAAAKVKPAETFWTKNMHRIMERRLSQPMEIPKPAPTRPMLLEQLGEMQAEVLRRLYAAEDCLTNSERLLRWKVVLGVRTELANILKFTVLMFSRLMPPDARYGKGALQPLRDSRLNDLVVGLNEVYQDLCEHDGLDYAAVDLGQWANAVLRPLQTAAQTRRSSQLVIESLALRRRRGSEAADDDNQGKTPGNDATRKIKVSDKFNEKDARKLWAVFCAVDTDQSGEIHMREIVGKDTAFAAMGKGRFDAATFKKFDKDRNGLISFVEILRGYFPEERPFELQKWADAIKQGQAEPTKLERPGSAGREAERAGAGSRPASGPRRRGSGPGRRGSGPGAARIERQETQTPTDLEKAKVAGWDTPNAERSETDRWPPAGSVPSSRQNTALVFCDEIPGRTGSEEVTKSRRPASGGTGNRRSIGRGGGRRRSTAGRR
eukprot:TRINITY_DN60099_c0_g1_i1.p1 TRINITY_DN60099_c0_g1~~TRINITY_DN60099_c0_g1_i1.p1  ORF type:complete len:1580 (+),score=353.06 TRINITY_DN60099_c0_g1_i1:98-4741(+)